MSGGQGVEGLPASAQQRAHRKVNRCKAANAPTAGCWAAATHTPVIPLCRAFTVAAVCTWWRQVALEGELVPELNLCRAPLFALRAEQLPDHARQLASFLCWLAPRAPRIRACILQAERWQANQDSTSCWVGGRVSCRQPARGMYIAGRCGRVLALASGMLARQGHSTIPL